MLNQGIVSVHLEPTARCNAFCPMCSRTNNPKILSNQGEISFDDFVKFFPEDFIKGLNQFKLCGNYGDPAIAKDLLEIHEYLYSINPDMDLMLSTNGGIRNERFWTELGKIYAKQPKWHVEFHIDGMEDTNHIYRIGVKWDKLMKNVKAFNATGAISGWFFIPFFHNEHQIEEAEALSKQIGCKEFVIKISARFQDARKPFVYEGGKLYPPTSDRFRIEKFQKKEQLKCVSEMRKEIFVDAWGRLWPCCWTASAVNRSPDWPMAKENPQINSLYHRSIKEIIDSKEMNDWIQSQYKCDTSVCHKRCTGSYIHVIDRQGIQKPQKEYWD